MKNILNNKGFTMVELLAVIVVIGIVMVLTIPSLFVNMYESKEEVQIVFKENLNTALERWVDVNKNNLEIDPDFEGYVKNTTIKLYKLKKKEEFKNIDGSYNIQLKDLIGKGMISKEEIINPSTSEECDKDVVITVYRDINFVYYFDYNVCGVSRSFENAIEYISVTGISSSDVALTLGETFLLSYSVVPSGATNKNVTFKSFDDTIVEVDEDGNLTGKKIGETQIEITSEDNVNIMKVINVSVKSKEIGLTDITVDKTEIILEVDDTDTILVSYIPSDATNKEVIFESSDESVATVDSNGNIEAISGGTTEITVSAKNNPDIKKTVKVTVINPVTMITTEYDSYVVTAGEKVQIMFAVRPSSATDRSVTFTSANESIASVTNNGWVTGVSGGKTTTVTIRSVQNPSVTKTVSITVTAPASSEFDGDTSGANAPDLTTGLIPVYYKGSGLWVVADTTKNWYNYDKQKWANAVAVTSDKRSSFTKGHEFYANTSHGVLAMFVWIPRFEYTIYNTYGKLVSGINASSPSVSTPGAIDIQFVSSSKEKVAGAAAYTTSGSPSGWYTHPAFTFNSKELSGIWVGKFESGFEDVLADESQLILPDLSKVTSLKVAEAYSFAQEFTASGNKYGLSGNSHLTKNVEWAAVAYLSQSIYGKYGNSDFYNANKEIYVNHSSDYTGKSSCDTGANTDEDGTIYNYFGGTNALCGGGASTTGNVTGVYDMVGGGIEYVMGNYNDTISKSTFSSMPSSIYYDKYTTTSIETSTTYKGHALYETGGWYNDYENNFSSSILSSNTWIKRGGYYGSGETLGIFYFGPSNGGATYLEGYHAVLTNN